MCLILNYSGAVGAERSGSEGGAWQMGPEHSGKGPRWQMVGLGRARGNSLRGKREKYW